MKMYPKYKDSGLEWIGEIPKDWNVTRLKFLSDGDRNSFIDGDWIESDVIIDEGIRYITTGNIGQGNYKEQGQGFISEQTFKELNCTEVFPGDLIISRLSPPVGRSCIIPNLGYRIVTSVDNVILRPHNDVSRFYLNYFFNHTRYQEWNDLISRGTTLTRISRSMLGNNSILLPPLSEQLQIVEFLDQKTSLIDTLIEKKLRKIELLKEQRKSIINHSVTKGLNPNVRMKDSGVEWIGEIPQQWDSIRMKYLCEMITEKGETDEGDIKISPENVESNTGKCFNLYSEYNGEGVRFKKGDVLLNKLRLYLVKILNPDYDGFSMGEMIVLRPRKIYGRYLFYTLFNQGLIDLLDCQSTGVKLPRVSPEIILDSFLPSPPQNEQKEIVLYLDKKTNEIEIQITLENKKIDLLKEYRQSLISEVVTGKIDVRKN